MTVMDEANKLESEISDLILHHQNWNTIVLLLLNIELVALEAIVEFLLTHS